MKRLLVLFILFLAVFMPSVFAESFDVYVDEWGKVTSFYDEYYIARVNGTLTITNPSPANFFNIYIPLYLSSYTLRSLNNTATNYIDETGIHVLEIAGNSSVVFEYEIGGISTDDFTENGNSMLETAISAFDLKIYSSILGSLLKAPFENSALTGRNNTRLMSIHLTNPTGFEFNVDFVHVIKTAINDPSAEINSWDFTSEISSLEPYEHMEFDFFDENAFEGEIYWLQTDIYLDEIDLFISANISSFDQDDLFVPITNGTEIIYNETVADFFEKRVFIRKLLSSNLALPGESLNVTIVVNNFGTTSLNGVLTDSFPFGFELKNVYTSDSTMSENSLIWDLDIAPRTAKRFVYEVEFVDEDSVGVDYFAPATITYGENFVYSQSVPFVRKFVAEKKIYLQKSLDFRPNGDVEVEITVRNLGESSLSNLIVKEFLGPGDEFKEITKPFREKGVWHIENLRAGEIWETSYVTDKSNVLNAFPELFGVPRSSLFRNIILKNIVESKFKILESNAIELVGISLLILVIFAYLLPHSTVISLKRKYLKDLKATDRELGALKESSSRRTNFHPNSHSNNSNNSSRSSSIQKSPALAVDKPHSDYLTQRQEKIDQTQAILDKIKERIHDEEK